MSTLFGIFKGEGEIILENDMVGAEHHDDDFIVVAYRGNGTGMRWKNELAPYLPPETKVYPLDNTAQGIYTIGDIIKEMEADFQFPL